MNTRKKVKIWHPVQNSCSFETAQVNIILEMSVKKKR